VLRELHISNLAVISDARVELAPGLNCFTGATGAGKSLVIGALEILLALRSPSELLRKGADEGRVTGLFEVSDTGLLRRIASAADIDCPAGELILTRRVFASGRTSASINGNPITLPMMRAVAEVLVDVHGQHDHQFLLKPANQLEVLDEFAAVTDLKARYHAAWRDLAEARRKLADLSTSAEIRRQQLELYTFQAGEIDEADLRAGEYAEVQRKASRLGSIERLQKEAGGVYDALIDSESAVASAIKSLASTLAQLAEIDPALANIANGLRDGAVAVEEAGFDLRRYLSNLDLDPSELASAQQRLTDIHRLASKYAGRVGKIESEGESDDVSRVLLYRRRIGQELESLRSQTDDCSALSVRLAPLERAVIDLGEQLRGKRRKSATALSSAIESELAELGMERAKFSVSIEPTDPGPTGADVVEFVATTNPGLAAAPLRRIASGGELSRIMLALKGILSSRGRAGGGGGGGGGGVSVLVFDEIDSNVGGRLGAVIGAKLRDLAARQQVLCITHLPQIAAAADRHLTVRKVQSASQTTSTVRVVDGDERIAELAEMIGGARITDTTRAQARELLESGAALSAKSPKKPAGKRPNRAAR
jgi:DNA repair protein RecN (Recombination protein N)